jgi:hypothetical protein
MNKRNRNPSTARSFSTGKKKKVTIASFFSPSQTPSSNTTIDLTSDTPNPIVPPSPPASSSASATTLWGALINTKKSERFFAYLAHSTKHNDANHALASHIKHNRPASFVSTKHQPVFLAGDRVSGCGSFSSSESPTNNTAVHVPSFDLLRPSMFGAPPNLGYKPFHQVASGNILCVSEWANSHFPTMNEVMHVHTLSNPQQVLLALVYYCTTPFVTVERLASTLQQWQQEDNQDNGMDVMNDEGDEKASLLDLSMVESVKPVVGTDLRDLHNLIDYLHMFTVVQLVALVAKHHISTAHVRASSPPPPPTFLFLIHPLLFLRRRRRRRHRRLPRRRLPRPH